MDLDLRRFCQCLHASCIELSPSLFLLILMGIAKGLNFLHLLEYVHRDISTCMYFLSPILEF
jgi:serine/threonine protein kinase